MSFNYLHRAMLLTLILLSPTVLAEDENWSLKTDWIELVKGYKDKTVGTEVRAVEKGDVEGTHKITLAIPKAAVKNPESIEEVVVVGRKPEEAEPLLDVHMKWLDDYDNDNYGLIIYLREDTNWPIRLYMSSEAGFTR